MIVATKSLLTGEHMSGRHMDGGRRLLWASEGSTDRSALDAAAAAYELQVQLCAPAEITSALHTSGDVVGIELGDDPSSGLAAIRELHGRSPGTTILAASRDAGVETLRAAMQAGAADVLSLPLVPAEIHKALLRVTNATPHAPVIKTAGQVITVYGVRGGLGATTVAVNLAFKLATATRAETALVDLDLQRGDVAAFVNLVPVHSLATLATASGDVDDVFLASAITRHGSGVAVLAAPPTMEEAELVGDREVELALRLLRSRFAFTVVDTPRVISSTVLTALEDSDRIFVLTDLSVPSVRAARRIFELLGRLDGPAERAELLITEIVPGPLDVKKAVQVIGQQPFAVIPRDDSAGSAMNDGVPLNGRPTRLALALDGLACRIAGLQNGGPKQGRRLLSRIFPKGARP